MLNNKAGLLSYASSKINLKWIKELNLRHETIKFLEKSIEGKHLDIPS